MSEWIINNCLRFILLILGFIFDQHINPVSIHKEAIVDIFTVGGQNSFARNSRAGMVTRINACRPKVVR